MKVKIKKFFSIKFKFNTGSVMIPHYLKKHKGGEDALAVKEGMICVADGVGGWNESGVDPSKFSRELCENITKGYNKNYHKYHNSPKNLFTDAVKNTTSIGSSTFCMAVLDIEKNLIHTVNLGDSGYMIIRDHHEESNNVSLNKILKPTNSLQLLYKSEEQTHSFNFPFQVGTYGDNPDDSISKTHEFEENDIIIMATDGLWDNLYENQIISIIKPFLSTNHAPDLNIIAEMIGEHCLKYSADKRYQSPFSKRSQGLYLGGKEDDITILVSQIVQNI
jgi:protein phosphatase PTC7